MKVIDVVVAGDVDYTWQGASAAVVGRPTAAHYGVGAIPSEWVSLASSEGIAGLADGLVGN